MSGKRSQIARVEIATMRVAVENVLSQEAGDEERRPIMGVADDGYE
jgi:hypothetical protein